MQRDKDIDDLYQFFTVVEQDQAVGINIVDTIEEYIARKDEGVRQNVRTVLSLTL